MTYSQPTSQDLAELGLVSSKGGDKSSITAKRNETASVQATTQAPPVNSKYDGDYIPSTEECTPLKLEGYTTCDVFDNPAHLITTLVGAFREKQETLHQWQIDQSLELAESFKTATYKNPYKLCLCAANGSGKDYLVISPFVIWSALTNIKCLTIITSASGAQLTSQTENYIRSLAHKVNEFFNDKVFHIRQRYIRCNLTGAEIRLFATDEEGKAEGYHPMEPGAKMIIVVNEAKNVSEEIFGALRRCTGYSHWLNVSTPGEPKGAFYNSFIRWQHVRHVTTYDCPHLSESDRQEDRIEMGEHSAHYRSKHLALFTLIGGEYIISTDLTDRLLNEPPQLECEVPVQVGIDLAAGGDETCVTIIKGCEVIHEEAFREKDTTVTADEIDRILKAQKIPQDYQYIFADDGGIGHGVIDNLVRFKKYKNINRLHNQSPALNKDRFGNRGAEMWENVKRILEENLFDITKLSPKTILQLTTRRRRKNEGASGRLFLESKKVAKAQGNPSPDRADAFILALCGRTIDDFIKATAKANPVVKRQQDIVDSRNFEEWYSENVTYADFNKQPTSSKRIFNSLKAAMN